MGRDEVSAGDMLIAAQRIQVFIAGMTEDAFMMNELVQSAVLHQVAILGEAAKRVSVEFRARHPQVAWAALAALRNRIVHEYDDISLDKLWDSLTGELPALVAALEGIVPPEPDGEEA